MIEIYIRPVYQKILVDPAASALRGKVSPNQLTLFSGIAGLLILPCLYFGASLLAIILLLFSGYLDTLDGTLARVSHCSSDWGSVLDITIDRLVEFVVILGLWVIAPEARGFWVIMMLGSILLCITSFLVVGIFTANESEKGFYYSPGIMERAEAFAFFVAMIIWPNLFSILAFFFSLLVLATAIIRLKQFYHAQQFKILPKTCEAIARNYSHD